MGTRTHFYLFYVELMVSGACWQHAPRPLAEISDWKVMWLHFEVSIRENLMVMKFFVVNANVTRYFKWCIQFSRVLIAGCWFVNHVPILSAQESKSVIKSANCRGLLKIRDPSVQRGKTTLLDYENASRSHSVSYQMTRRFLRAKLCYSFRNKTSFMIFFSIPLFIKVSDHMINVNCDLIDLFNLEIALGLSSWKKASSVTLWFWVNSNVTCRSKQNRGHLKTLSHLILWRTG